MAEITKREMVQELNRELSMRHRAYPRWVAGGTLKQADADRYIARLVAVKELLEKMIDDEKAATEPTLDL